MGYRDVLSPRPKNIATTKLFLRHVNVTCTIFFVLLAPPSFFMGGFSALLLFLSLTAIAVAIRSKMGHLRAGLLALSIMVGVTCVCIAGALGYLLNGDHILSGGEMRAAEGYSTIQSVGSGFFAPFASIPTLLGHGCNTEYGSDCSNSLFLSVDFAAVLILGGAVVVGNVLVRRQFVSSKTKVL